MIQIVSHPMSGAAIVREILAEVFGADHFGPPLMSVQHWSRSNEAETEFNCHSFWPSHTDAPVLCVYRDGRDVVTSVWKSESMHNAEYAGQNLLTWLSKLLDWHGSPATPHHPKTHTITQHWRDHVTSWHRSQSNLPHASGGEPQTLCVRYEDFLFPHLSGGKLPVIDEIATYFNLISPRPATTSAHVIDGLHIPGVHRKYFTQAVTRKFYTIVWESSPWLFKGEIHGKPN